MYEKKNGIPATGKGATWSGVTIVRLFGGRIVEYWLEADNLGFMGQIGVVPVPELSTS